MQGALCNCLIGYNKVDVLFDGWYNGIHRLWYIKTNSDAVVRGYGFPKAGKGVGFQLLLCMHYLLPCGFVQVCPKGEQYTVFCQEMYSRLLHA